MRLDTILPGFLLPFLLSAILVPVSSATRAADCGSACRSQHFQQRAITQGPGTHSYYDETSASVRTFVVTRSARDGGGARYDIAEIAATPVPVDDDLFRSSGGAFMVAQLALPARTDAGTHSDMSAFDLFVPIRTASNTFGIWLGKYLKEAGLPVAVPSPPELAALQSVQRGVRYGSTLDRRMLRVVFKDGEALFALSIDDVDYRYVDNSARDIDGHRIPASLEQMRDEGPYTFSGRASSSWRGFERLLAEYYVPQRDEPPQWRCDDTGDGGLRCAVTPGKRLRSPAPAE
jgi:hypothetical protein